jgi:hypothetical protein
MVNIDNCLDMLKAAARAIEAAPQKGFINLDAVKDSILKTCELIKEISPRLQFSEQLVEDEHREILARLKVLKKAGAVALIDQARRTLESGQLEYKEYRDLRDEIDREFDKIFRGQVRLPSSANQPDAAKKPEDYS